MFIANIYIVIKQQLNKSFFIVHIFIACCNCTENG